MIDLIKQRIGKPIWLLVIFLSLAKIGKAQQLTGKYTLIVDVGSVKSSPAKIYFWYSEFIKGEKVNYQDSAIVKNHRVTFQGVLNEPHEAFLSVKPRLSGTKMEEGEVMNFYLSPGELKIRTLDSLNTYVQTGGSFNNDFQDFKKVKSLHDHRIISLAIRSMKMDKHKDSVLYQQNEKRFQEAVDFYNNKVCPDWVRAHSSSPVALLPLNWYAGSVINHSDLLLSLYNKLAAPIKKLPAGLDLKSRIDRVREMAIGNQAALFTLADTSGKPISLIDYRGKYVLLDFWASWCAPCRRENPNVLSNFNRFKNSNFTVIGISLDSESGKSAWLKAIQNDHLTQWANVSDLKGFNNQAARLYSVQAVPQNFLIDPSGKIIAKNITGKALTEKLETLFPQNDNFRVNGKIGHLSSPAKAYLNYKNEAGWQMDSTEINDGAFRFSGMVPKDVRATLFLNNKGTGVRSRDTKSYQDLH